MVVTPQNVMDVCGLKGLQTFFRILRSVGISELQARQICQAAQLAMTDKPGPLKQIERKWYESLAAGKPDYSLYSLPVYIAETYFCWDGYSRKYAKMLPTIKGKLGPVRSIVDLGAGHGFSSLALANAFPGASVTATNLPTSVQWAMAEKIRGSAFRLAPKAPKAKVDMIFASEYFEHFDHPLDHLEEVLGLCQPRIAVVANAFTAKATGHFDRYTVGGASVDGKTASKRFNDHMRAQGYAKLETGFWNNRPVVWVRQ